MTQEQGAAKFPDSIATLQDFALDKADPKVELAALLAAIGANFAGLPSGGASAEGDADSIQTSDGAGNLVASAFKAGIWTAPFGSPPLQVPYFGMQPLAAGLDNFAIGLSSVDGTANLLLIMIGGALQVGITKGTLSLDNQSPLSLNGSPGNLGDSIISQGAGVGPQWGAAGIQTAVVTVSSAEIKALHGSIKTIIASPGTGKYIRIIAMDVKSVFGTTPYTVGGSANLTFFTGGGVTQVINQNGFLDQSADKFSYFNGAPPGAFGSPENAPLRLTNSNATDASVGDGTLKVTVLYKILDS